jgi:outer membrane protein OmpA-like peptidoglycan-associated protein
LGYRLTRNLWLSGGYNLYGINDPDLTAGTYMNRGFYVRLRFKFDETTFGLGAGGQATPPLSPSPPRPVVVNEAAAAQAASHSPLETRATMVHGDGGSPRIEWLEQRVFESGRVEVSAQGQRLLTDLMEQLAGAPVGPIRISVGHGDTDLSTERMHLWTARAAALRRALLASGPREVSIGVDTQALAPLAPSDLAQRLQGSDEYEVRALRIAVKAAVEADEPTPAISSRP